MWCERDGETASGEKARAHPACRARGIGAYVYRRIYSFWLKERDKVRRNAASHEKHVKWKRQQQESCNIMQHATADRRTTARAIYLPETPYHPPASTTHPIEHSNPSVRRQIQKEEGENRKQHKRRRTSKKENVRLTVQLRTRTEKYSVPPVRPTAPARAPPARCSSPSHSFGCPGSGSISRRRRRGRNPGPVSWECRNTACARKRGNTT